MSVARVTLRFDVIPEEKERLEKVCEAYGIKKIDFLRASITLAEKEIIETSNNLLKGYQHEQPRFYEEEYMKHFKERQKEGK